MKRLNLSTTGKVVLIGLVIGLALLFFAPDHTIQGVGLLIVVVTVLPICYAGAALPARKSNRTPKISDAVTPPDSAWEREARRRRKDRR